MFKSRRFQYNIPLFIMFAPIIAYFLIFKFAPMGGLVIAFKNYNFTDGIWGSSWVGLDHFHTLFTNPNMLNILRNTLVLSFLQLVLGFPFPILLALMINEIRRSWFKKTVQTAVFFPHFLNWVIVGGIVVTIFAQETGIVNNIMRWLTGDSYPYLYNTGSWLAIFIGSGIWKSAGWGAIIYLAALAGVDQSLYEAAGLDGANRLRQMWHISLPSIRPVIFIILILSIGSIMEVGFDQVYMLQNSAVSQIADVISTWNYRVGITGGRFSLAAALGFFESIIGLILVLTANAIARRFNNGLW